MKIRTHSLWWIVEQVVPWAILVILILYTYAKFFGHPYGFRWDASRGAILYVFDRQPEPTLRAGDQIVQIGDVTWQQYRADLRQTFFNGVEPGDVVPIIVDRNGQLVSINWVYPRSPGPREFLDQLISEWFIAYFFWLAGLLTVVLVRPRDERRVLMASFNFLTAIWLISGSGVSLFQIWNSALVLRMGVLLCIPVYLHLHWVFPQPLRKLPPGLIRAIYGVTLLLVIAQGFQLLPRSLYLSGFLVASGGSFILLLIHVLRQPTARRDLRLLFVAALLAMALATTWAAFVDLHKIPAWLGSAGLLGLPLLPLAYLYSAFRHRLGGLEMRVNRFFSIYLFVVLLGIIELPLLVFLDQVFRISGEVSAISFMSSMLTAVAFIWGYPAFENFVEHRILGIPLPSKGLLETFSTRITTSLSFSDLIHVLHEEVFPSLLVRQFAFLQHETGSLNVLSTMGLDAEQLPAESDLPELLARSGVYRSPELASWDQPYTWIRLILPLKLGDRLIGFWLLGRRDPDDHYSQKEIPVFSSLANLTAIALNNIVQTEQLKSMYETNIGRYEQEKLRLARDLHDSILNEMAALLISGEAPVLPPGFQQAYDALTEHLREIVNDLRPPMLVFGLKLAFEDFAENLRERNQDSVEIQTDIQADGEWRYQDVVENNLYRIVQEACENALHHARPKKILIFGRLSQDQIDIRVEDDGIGLDSGISLKLSDLLANKHFGLVGMLERVNLIGAEISFNSKPKEGTRVQVLWKSKPSI